MLATPATAVVAPPIPGSEEMNLQTTEQLLRFSLLGNFLGPPSIVFPVGQAAPQGGPGGPEGGGLPIAMMLTGRWWREHTLLRLAHAAETLRGEENGLPARRAPAHLDIGGGHRSSFAGGNIIP